MMEGVNAVFMEFVVSDRATGSVEYIPGFSTLVAVAKRFADDAQRLGRQHMLQLEILELENDILGEYQLDAVGSVRVVFPAALDLGAIQDHQAQRFHARR